MQLAHLAEFDEGYLYFKHNNLFLLSGWILLCYIFSLCISIDSRAVMSD